MTPRRATRGMVVAAVVVATVLGSMSVAWAGFGASSAASQTLATDTLAPPTAPGVAAGTCVILTSDQLVVSWTASASTWADGYAVYRSTAPGVPTVTPIATVGAGVTSWTDTTVAFSTTYYYVVTATKLAWTSAASSEVSATTKTSLCVV